MAKACQLAQYLFDKQEPLAEEFERYVSYDAQLGRIVRHPLVYCIVAPPEINAVLNQQLLAKTRAVRRAEEECNWDLYVYLHERAYRLQAFSQIVDEIDDKTYWRMLGDIWTDSENIWQNEAEWQMFLSAKRALRRHLMNKDECKVLKALPDMVYIFRGSSKSERRVGMSWTTELVKAEWFANRFTKPQDVGFVTSACVDKKDIIAYINRRGEDEVIVLQKHVTLVQH